MRIIRKISLTIFVLLFQATQVTANDAIILQSTTSTKNSGLYDYLIPLIKEDTGVSINVVAVGTGAAIKNAANCDGDLLLVHDTPKEIQFIEQGFGIQRFDLMYNDFVLVGPKFNPANIDTTDKVLKALKKIAKTKSLFVSRGDESGTDAKEKSLWNLLSIKVQNMSGTWYRETGAGMGTTLNIAVGMGAYTLVDRATWITFNNREDFEIIVENEKILFNQYGLVSINATNCPNINLTKTNLVIKWLLSKEGQTRISSYGVKGETLFFSNFKK
ncbi:MAG: substrate-binding domain-containing protein [Paracoccaceae bacterium]|jgi:tungstate transport system substrate-binding protein|nr:substrate-binding domain-containing protein [Paracoccaceae bacterium]